MVIDNERYGETGMQATHTASGVDLAGIAKASRFQERPHRHGRQGIAGAAKTLVHRTPGPNFVTVKVIAEKIPLVLPPREGALLKARFRRALLGRSADAV